MAFLPYISFLAQKSIVYTESHMQCSRTFEVLLRDKFNIKIADKNKKVTN